MKVTEGHGKRRESHVGKLTLAALLLAAWAGLGPQVEAMRADHSVRREEQVKAARNGTVALVSWLDRMFGRLSDDTPRNGYIFPLADRRLRVTASRVAGAVDVKLAWVSEAECRNLGEVVAGTLSISNVALPASISVNGSDHLIKGGLSALTCEKDRMTSRTDGEKDYGSNEVVLRYLPAQPQQ